MKRVTSLLAAALVALPALTGAADARDKDRGGFPLQLRSNEDGFSVRLGNTRLKVRLREKRKERPVAVAAPRRVPKAPRNSMRPEARPVYWALPDEQYANFGYEDGVFRAPEADLLPTPAIARPTTPNSPADPASGTEGYEIDTSFVEHDAREIDRIATLDGDVIAVGDRLAGGADRFSAIGAPALLGLPPVASNEVYLRVADAAVRMEAGTERVVAILALDDVVIE